MIAFDIDQRYQDDQAVGRAMSRREGILLSIVMHGAVMAFALIVPHLQIVQDLFPEPEPLVAEIMREVPEEEARFVFVQPRVELPAPEPPPVAELSDVDRQAQDPEMAALSDNALPFSLGNSSERILEVPDEDAASEGGADPVPESTVTRFETLDDGLEFAVERPASQQGSLLADALRNLERYVQGQTFDNPQGGANDPGAAIQFDTRGVDFGPWLRRFQARVYSNWFVPVSALVMRGEVVLQFNIHRNGRISDIRVVRPSAIEGFNVAAYNAIFASSPLDPLPEEYPLDPALFTVTFYYNR